MSKFYEIMFLCVICVWCGFVTGIGVYSVIEIRNLKENSVVELKLTDKKDYVGIGTTLPKPVAKFNVCVGAFAGSKMIEKGGTHNIYLGPFVDGGMEKEDYMLRIGSFSREMKENEVLVHKLTKEEWATMYMAIKGLLPEDGK